MVSAGNGAMLGAVLVACMLGVGGIGGALAASSRTTPCPVDKFDCKNGKCISGSQWCDGIDTCGNNADELSCRVCLSGSLKCKSSTQCVHSKARCNGKVECQDGSDELGCDIIVTEPAPPVSIDTQPMEMTNGASKTMTPTFMLFTGSFIAFFLCYTSHLTLIFNIIKSKAFNNRHF